MGAYSWTFVVRYRDGHNTDVTGLEDNTSFLPKFLSVVKRPQPRHSSRNVIIGTNGSGRRRALSTRRRRNRLDEKLFGRSTSELYRLMFKVILSVHVKFLFFLFFILPYVIMDRPVSRLVTRECPTNSEYPRLKATDTLLGGCVRRLKYSWIMIVFQKTWFKIFDFGRLLQIGKEKRILPSSWPRS